MQMNESIENYLEMILMLQQKKGFARSIDIATELSVTKASVSHATKLLRQNGYITMEADGLITLSQSGHEIASKMLKRHRQLARFLMNLGVSEQAAFEDACKMEHDLSEETFNAICNHAEGMCTHG